MSPSTAFLLGIIVGFVGGLPVFAFFFVAALAVALKHYLTDGDKEGG